MLAASDPIDLSFYSTAAQVIPVMLLVLVFEIRTFHPDPRDWADPKLRQTLVRTQFGSEERFNRVISWGVFIGSTTVVVGLVVAEAACLAILSDPSDGGHQARLQIATLMGLGASLLMFGITRRLAQSMFEITAQGEAIIVLLLYIIPSLAVLVLAAVGTF